MLYRKMPSDHGSPGIPLIFKIWVALMLAIVMLEVAGVILIHN